MKRSYKLSFNTEAANTSYAAMIFGENGNAVPVTGDRFGEVYIDKADSSAVITYTEGGTNIGKFYCGKLKLTESGITSEDKTFVRVMYIARLPENTPACGLYIWNDKTGENVTLKETISDTNGEYVLSDVCKMPSDMSARFAGTGVYGGTQHNTFYTDLTECGAEIRIKNVFFFSSLSDAQDFQYTDSFHSVTVCGTDIGKYRIVIPHIYKEKMSEYAHRIKKQAGLLTGADIPVVTDTEPEQPFEILLGRTNRALSDYVPSFVTYDPEDFYKDGWVGIKDGKIILGSRIAPVIGELSELFCRVYLFKGSNGPTSYDITEEDEICAESEALKCLKKWIQPLPSDVPEVLCADFSTDDGYFTEDNGENNFKIDGGCIKADTDGFAAAYMHIYEKNVTVRADFTPERLGRSGGFGLMLRVNSEDAYVKAGYDTKSREWYIENRDGWDFYLERTGRFKADIETGATYTVELRTDFDKAKLTVNGKCVIEAAYIAHVSPGRIGIFSDNASVSVKSFVMENYSKMGTLMRNIRHTKLDYDNYLEGGTVVRMTDGSFVYNHQSGVTFLSDDAVTWRRGMAHISEPPYINIMRIANGELMKITSDANGNIFSCTSGDDGATWVRGGNICKTKYKGTAALACNMNDKITQSGTTGRIFYSQNYEAPADKPVDGRLVFCEFYYSDDNGESWTKSETDSWEIEGFESLKSNFHFGECKLIECADGTVRVYNSWNWSGFILFADSHDGGKTFGPLMRMEDFVIPHSSMQLVRDVYSENKHEYYMLWITHRNSMIRGVLNIAHSIDGKNWDKLGEIWHWETSYYNYGAPINHVIDPFITTTEELVICGAGCSDHMKKEGEGGGTYHQAQRQHIWTIPKTSLSEIK